MSLPRINPLAGLTDYAALQDDLTTMLLNHAPLASVNVVQERKFLLDASLQIDALWLTPRNGLMGLGIVVEDIRPTTDQPNTQGPVSDLLCSFVVLGEMNLAMTPGTGCLLRPEQCERHVVDLFHLKLVQPYGQLRVVDGVYAEPAADWIEADQGVYARRVKFRMLDAVKQTPTCDLVSVSSSVGTVSITCSSAAPDLRIFYTLDGSCPANPAINPVSIEYTEPFAAGSGTVVRAAAFAPGYNQSAVKQVIVT